MSLHQYQRWVKAAEGHYHGDSKRKAELKLEEITERWTREDAEWDELVAAERARADEGEAATKAPSAEAQDVHDPVTTESQNAHDPVSTEAQNAYDFISAPQKKATANNAEATINLAQIRVAKHLRIALGFAGPAAETIWSKSAREMGVRVEIPTFAQFPKEKSIRVSSRTENPVFTYLPLREQETTYARYIAEVALGASNAALEFTPAELVERVVVEVFVDSPNPATGVEEVRTLLSLILTREEWSGLALMKVDPITCIKGLASRVSSRPQELVPVQPLARVYADDERFVEHANVIDKLDDRPNLMDLTPGEFESLVQNLFERMGLETRQTRASQDGGVNAVAYDPRPIVGGKIVIQAKRYKNPVGVSAVRDLYGTLQNEGGSKGVLVTTSRYGRASYDFAKNKPLELIDGPALLFLLKEHCELEARIVPPDDWVDPVADSREG
jgi:restriction system protein